jgi:hypothetical protein
MELAKFLFLIHQHYLFGQSQFLASLLEGMPTYLGSFMGSAMAQILGKSPGSTPSATELI